MKPGARLALAVLTPLGFGLAPLLSLCKANPTELPLSDLPRPLVASVLLSLMLLGLTTLLCRRDPVRGSVAASVLLLFAWNFGLFADLLRPLFVLALSSLPPQANAGIPSATVGLWVLVAGGALLILARWQRALVTALSVLAPMSAALLLLAIPWRSAPQAAPPAPEAPPKPQAARPLKPSDLPDLYIVVLDAYGRHDVLKTLYDFDDGSFVDGLRARGFQVPTKSRANYLQTSLAVGALFQLDYWQTSRISPSTADTVGATQERIPGSPLLKLLRERGYHSLALPTSGPISTTFAEVVLRDDTLPPGTFTELENLALDRTPFTLLPRGQSYDYDSHRQTLRGALRFLGEPPPGPAPHFVFCHILAPHPPFVLGPNGENLTPAEPFHIGDATDFSRRGGSEDYRTGYAGQAAFVGKSVLDALDRLRAASKRPAAFLILGDHGPRRFTDWNGLSHTYVPEGFGNLVAVSVPERDRARLGALPGEITPINALRRLLDATLKTDLAPLPDRSYYSTLKNGFAFTDVTAAAHAPVSLTDAERVHPQSR